MHSMFKLINNYWHKQPNKVGILLKVQLVTCIFYARLQWLIPRGNWDPFKGLTSSNKYFSICNGQWSNLGPNSEGIMYLPLVSHLVGWCHMHFFLFTYYDMFNLKEDDIIFRNKTSKKKKLKRKNIIFNW
jgi:hypothetical protein